MGHHGTSRDAMRCHASAAMRPTALSLQSSPLLLLLPLLLSLLVSVSVCVSAQPTLTDIQPRYLAASPVITLIGTGFEMPATATYRVVAFPVGSDPAVPPDLTGGVDTLCSSLIYISSTKITCSMEGLKVNVDEQAVVTLTTEGVVLQATFSLYGIPHMFTRSTQISALSFAALQPSTVTFNGPDGDFVRNQDSWLRQAHIEIGFFPATAPSQSNFVACTLLTYIDERSFSCTMKFPSVGKWKAAMNLRKGFHVVYAINTQDSASIGQTNANLLLVTVYPQFSMLYSSASAYPTEYTWGKLETPGLSSTGQQLNTFRMVLPMSATTPAVSGRGLVFRFIAPRQANFPEDYKIQRVSVGLRSSGNLVHADSGTNLLPSAFPSTYTPLTFYGLPWETAITATGITHIDSDPVQLDAFCFTNSAEIAYDLVLTVQRAWNSFAPDLKRDSPAVVASSVYSISDNSLIAEVIPTLPRWDTIQPAAVFDGLRGAVALHSVYMTAAHNPDLAACKQPVIASISGHGGGPYFSPVSPRWVYANARVAISGANFQEGMRVNYTVARTVPEGTIPRVYRDLQFTQTSVCTNPSALVCNGPALYPCSISCNIGDNIGIGYSAYFIVYSPTVSTQISAPSSVGATIYPDILAGSMVDTQTASAGALSVLVRVMLNLSMPGVTAENWNTFNFQLGYIAPGYVGQMGKDTWQACASSTLDIPSASVSCQINYIAAGVYTFKAWFQHGEGQGNAVPGVRSYSSTASGSLSTLLLYPHYTEVFKATMGTSIEYSTKLIQEGGKFPLRPGMSTGGSGSLRFFLDMSTLVGGASASSIIMRLQPLASSSYRISHVSIGLGDFRSASVFAGSEQRVRWLSNPAEANWTYGIRVPAGASIESHPIPFCVDPTRQTAGQDDYDLVVTLHVEISSTVNTLLPALSGDTVPAPAARVYWWPDALTVGASKAAEQASWKAYPDARFDDITKLFALGSLTGVSNEVCRPRPVISDVNPKLVAPGVAFTVTISGSNFVPAAGSPAPLVHYAKLTTPPEQFYPNPDEFNMVCTNVVVKSASSIECQMGASLDPASDYSFVVRMGSGLVNHGALLLSWPSQSFVRTTPVMFPELNVAPMSGAAGVSISSVILSFRRHEDAKQMFQDNQAGVAVSIGYKDPVTGAVTPCGSGSAWDAVSTRRYECKDMVPSRVGVYLFVAMMASGVHAVSVAATGGAFTAYPLFAPIYSYETDNPGNPWMTHPAEPAGRTRRILLPASYLRASGGNLVVRMRLEDFDGPKADPANPDASTLFDTLSLSVGHAQLGPEFPPQNAFAPFVVPVLFNAFNWTSETGVPGEYVDSQPVPFCINAGSTTQLSLLFTLHLSRAIRSWQPASSVTSFGLLDSDVAISYPGVYPARQSRWDQMVAEPASTDGVIDSRIYGLVGLYATMDTSAPSHSWGNNSCFNPRIDSVMLGTTLPAQPLLITLTGAHFNNGSQAQLLRSVNHDGVITALQVSYIVEAASGGGTTPPGQDFKLGNSAPCAGVQVLSSTSVSCTLSTLTTANVGQPIQLQVFQFGQLSNTLKWTIGLPTFVDVLRNVTASPHNAKTIPMWDPLTSPASGAPTPAARAVLATLELVSPFVASQFLTSGVLGYVAPTGAFVPCTNVTVQTPSRIVCGVLPYWQGDYLFQVSFHNGYVSTARYAAHGLFRAWSHFGSHWSTAEQYFNNPAVADRGYGTGPKMDPQDPQTYRFTISKDRFNHSSQIALRLVAQESYSVNYVSIGFGLPGRQDVYPNSVVPVLFNGRSWKTNDAAANAAAWAEPAVVPRGFYLDSTPIPFCMLPPASRSWDLIVTIHLVSGTEVPVVRSALPGRYNSFFVLDTSMLPPAAHPATLPNWSDLPRVHGSQVVTSSDLRAAFLIDNLLGFDNATCTMPVISTIYPRFGAALTNTTITIGGSGFNLGHAGTPNANPHQWIVTYGIRSSTGSYTNTLLPASTSVCGSVVVLSDTQLTCVTSNDIGIGQQAEFLLSNGQVGTMYRSYMSGISSEVFTARVPLFSGVLISPQSIEATSPNQVLTVYLPQNVVGSGFNVTRASFSWTRHEIGFVGTLHDDKPAPFAPCSTLTWIGTPEQESAGCVDCTTFRCLISPLGVATGQYWLQANFYVNGTSDEFSLSAPENFKMTSMGVDSSSQFFVAYTSIRYMVSTAPPYVSRGFKDEPTGSDKVAYTFVPSFADPGNQGATYRFAIPLTTLTFSSPISTLVVRMAAQHTAYSFSSMTIALGSSTASNEHANQNVFSNTVQPVTFGGARSFPSAGSVGPVDTLVTVRANTTLDSNPIFFCAYPAASQLWNVIVTLHGVVGSRLPALRSSMSPLPPSARSYVYNDGPDGSRGSNVSLWNPLLGTRVFPHGDVVAVGIDSIFSVRTDWLPSYYQNSMPKPPSGLGLCSGSLRITGVRGSAARPLAIYPRTATTITLTGSNFAAAGMQVYYGLFGGFGPVPLNTTTAPTHFVNNPCTDVRYIVPDMLTCMVGTNIQRGQSVRFIVFRESLVSDVSPPLATEINYVLRDVQAYNGNSFVSPLLDNPFVMQPAFDPQVGLSGADRNPVHYSVAIPFGIDALNISVSAHLPDAIKLWHIGSGDTLAQALSGAGAPVWRTILTANFNSILLQPLAVGNNYFQLWNSVDDLSYTMRVVKAAPDINSIVVTAFPLSLSMASPSLPSTYTPATRRYTMRVPFITTQVSIGVNFTSRTLITVSLNDTNLVDLSLLVPPEVAPIAAALPPTTFSLGVGTNALRVHSPVDGDYTWLIDRQDPDTNAITLVFRDVYGKTSNTTLASMKLDPVFDARLVEPHGVFEIAVDYVQDAVAVVSDFDTPSTQSVRSLISPTAELGYYIDAAGYALYALPAPIRSRARSGWFNLTHDVNSPDGSNNHNGLNTLQVNSSLDGSYLFRIRRAKPMVRSVHVKSSLEVEVGASFDAPITSFQPGVFNLPSYALVVGRHVHRIQVIATFMATGAFHAIYFNINHAPNSTTPPAAIAGGESGTYIETGAPKDIPYTLDIGLNHLYIVTKWDGTYVIPITRQTSDISALVLVGYSPTSYPAAELPFPPLAPSFNPGTSTRDYSVTVPFGVWTMRVNITFVSVDTISIKCNEQAPIEFGSVKSGELTPGVFNLNEGVNVIVIESRVEGSYTLRVTRSTSDITSLNLNNVDPDTLTPAPSMVWTAATYTYSGIVVSFGSERLNPALTYRTAGSIQMHLNDVEHQRAPRLTTPTGIVSFNLTQEDNVFTIESTQNGRYTFHIKRLPADLTDITVQAQSVSGGTSAFALSPLFKAGLRIYDLALSYKYRTVQFRVQFKEPPQDVDINSPSMSSYRYLFNTDLASEVWSNPLEVLAQTLANPQGTFDFKVFSKVDRTYTIRVNRAVNNVQELRVLSDQLDAGVKGSELQPKFEAGIYSYTVQMPYAVSSVRLAARMLRNETLRLDSTDVLTGVPATQTLEHGQTAGPFGIYVDRSLVLRVSSDLDGDFTLTITRLPPVLQLIEVTPMFPTSPLDPTLRPFVGAALDRPFTPPNAGYADVVLSGTPVRMNYSMSVSFSLTHLRVVVGYADSRTVVTVLNNSTALSLPTVVRDRDNVTAPALALEAGPNQFLLHVDRDGTYIINVHRSMPDLTNLTLHAYNDSRTLLQRELSLYTYVAGTLPRTPLTLPLSKFRPGQSLYAVYVPYSYRFVGVGSLSWTLAANISVDVTSGGSTRSEVIVRQFDPRYQTQFIPDSALYPLHTGTLSPNTLRLNHSIDGQYLFSIYRGERTITLINLPTDLQANFSTSAVDPNAPPTPLTGKGIGLHLTEGLTLPAIIVAVSCDAGSVSPSSLNFGTTLLAQTLFFQYTAPYVTANRVATISFRLTGNDAWQIDQLPNIRVNIFPANTSIIGSLDLLAHTVPQSVLINSVSHGITVVPSAFSGRPQMGNALVLLIFLSSGSASPANLTFTHDNWHSNQTFSLVAPALAANVTLRFGLVALNGISNMNNAEQYSYPSNSSAAVIRVMATVKVDTIAFPARLYNQQLSGLIGVSCAGIAATNFTLSISSPATSVVFNASTLVYSRASVGSVHYFRIQPMFGNLKSATVVYVNFAVSGADAHDYAPIPQLSLMVQPQALFTMSGVPTSLYIGGSMDAQRWVSLTPSEATLGRIMMQVESSGSAIAQGLLFDYNPSALMMGSIAPLRFRIVSAPSVPQTLTLTFKLTFEDAPHYQVPAPLVIPVLDRAPILVLRVPGATFQNQLISNIQIKPSVILSLDQYGGGFSVGVQASPAGTFTPSDLFSFGVGTPESASFNFLPPSGYTGTVTLSYTVQGPDAAIYRAVPTNTITVLSQGSFSVTGLPAGGVSSNAVVTLTVAPIKAPSSGASVTLTLLVDGASILSASTLTFTSTQSQPFVFRAPSAPTALTIQWSVGGAAAPEFSQPSPMQLVVLAAMNVVSHPARMYVKQTSNPIAISMQVPSLSAPQEVFPAYLTVTCSPSTVACTAIPAQVAFPTPAASSFVFVAPSAVPAGGSITLHFALVGLATGYFTPPSPITIGIQAQNTVSVAGSLVVYAFDSTALTLMPSAPVSNTTLLTFSLGTNPGSIVPSQITMPMGYSADSASYMGPLTVRYVAPSFVAPAQSIPVVATASGPGAAQFAPLAFNIDMRGARVLSVCAPSGHLYVTGVLADGGDWNGVYTAAVPINDKAHYAMASPTIAGRTYHLFYFVDPSGVYPNAWMLDVDASLLASHAKALVNTDVAAPFSNLWTAGQRTAGSTGPSVSTMSVTCGVDCPVLGKATSLETQVCFGGVPLLTSTILPAVCPLSCARYLPPIHSACKDTPFYRDLAAVSYGIGAMMSSCRSCNYTFVAQMMDACKIGVASSDITQDLLHVMRVPDTCSATCAPAFNAFFATCVANQPVVPVALAHFNAQCAPSQPPRAVASMSLVEARADSLLLTWPVAKQVQLTPLPISYVLRVASYPYLAGAQANDASFWVTVSNGTENGAVLRNLAVNTTYRVSVVAGSSAGPAPPSAPFAFTTLPASPPPPVAHIDYTPFALIDALASSLPPTYSSSISWPLTSTSVPGSNDTLYRVTIARALDSTGLSFGPALVAYTGVNNQLVHDQFMPGFVYQLSVQAAQYRPTGAVGRTSQWGASFVTTVTVPVGVPNAPSLLSSFNVHSAGLTLHWNNVFFCGSQSCAGVMYELSFFNHGLGGGSTALTSLAVGAAPSTTVGAITGRWVSLVNVSYPASAPTSSAMSYTWNGASAGSDYEFRIRALQSSRPDDGASAWSPLLAVRTAGTLPSVTRAPVYTPLGSSAIVASWNHTSAFYLDGFSPVDSVHFHAVPASSASTGAVALDFFVSPIDIQPNAQGSTTHSFTLSGLDGGVTYQLTWECRNALGWSGLARSPIISISVPHSPPRFVSLVARDLTGSMVSFGNGAQLVATFDRPTNKPELSTPAQLSSFFAFSSVVPATLAPAVWNADGTVLTMVVSAASASTSSLAPAVGVFTARVIGDLRTQSLTSPSLATESNALYTTQTLLGSWASTAGRHLLSASSVVVVPGASVANPVVPQVAPASSAVQYPDSAIVIQLSVSNGQVVYPYNPAAGFQLVGAQSQSTLSINGHTYARLLSTDSRINPLHQIAYTPSTSFYGSDALVVSLSGSFGVEQLSIPLTVLRANHKPVITVPAAPLPFNPFNSDGVALAGLMVSDEDNLPSTPLRVTFSSLSPSAWFAYTNALPTGMTSAQALNQRTLVLTLSGAYAQLVPFLPTVVWFDPSIDPDSSTSTMSVNVRAEDLGSGITGAQSMLADAVYRLVPQCGSSAPSLLGVQFTPDLSALMLRFDSRVKVVLPASVAASQTQSSNCAHYLSSASLALIGSLSSASCYMSAPSVLTVQLGAGFTARVSSPLSLASGVIRRCMSSLVSAAAPTNHIAITAPAQPLMPSVLVQGPSSLGICQDLQLTTVLANVTGPLQYVWAVGAPGVLPESVDSAASSLTIPASKLVAGSTYTFTLFVVNLVGSSSPISTLRVSKERRPTPTLLPITNTQLTVQASDALQLVSFASLSACLGDSVTPTSHSLVFSWSAVAVPAATVTLDAVSRVTSSLTVRAGTLQPGSSYTFTVQASVAGDSSLSSTLSFNVNVKSADAAIVASSSSQLVSSNATIVLTAPGSAAAALPLVWSCQMASGAACFNLLTQQPLPTVQLAAGVGLTVSAGTLVPGSYLFIASTITSGGQAGVLVHSVWLTVSPSVTAPLVTVRASSTRVGTNDPLTLSATVLSPNGSVILAQTSPGVYQFAWSMSPNSSSWSGLADATVSSGLASNTLTINGRGRLLNVFPRGASLRFRLTVTHVLTGQFGFAEASVSVASPPVGGTVTVQPRSGVAGSTVFEVSANGWIGGAGLTYHYSTVHPMDGSLVGFGSTHGSAHDRGLIAYAGAASTNNLVQLVLEVRDLAGSVTTVRIDVTVLPNTNTGSPGTALAAAANAQYNQIQLMSTSGSLSQLVAYISAQSLASQQMLSSGVQVSAPTFNGVPISTPYAASYPRCYPSQLASGSAWDPSPVSTPGEVATSALIARSNQLLDALVSSVSSVSAAQGLTACLSLSNDAGVSVSLASVLRLLTPCQSVTSGALIEASSLCSTSSIGCFAQQQILVQSALATSVSMIQSYLTSAASATAAQSLPLSGTNRRLLATGTDSIVLPQLLSLLSSSYDRVSQLLLQSAGQSYFNNDCQVVSMVSRDSSSGAFSYVFPDGSAVAYPSAWLRSSSSATATLDTRLSYHAVSPFIFHRTTPSISVVSGVLFTARTDSNALLQSTAHASFAGTFTLRYNRLLVNASFPLCLMWNADSATWSPFSADGGNVTTRFPSQVNSALGFVDCIVNGAARQPIVAAFNSPHSTMGAPLIVPVSPASSTGAGGGLGSSTGAAGGAPGSTGPDDSFGPLGPPPPLILAPDQHWSINFTMVLALDVFFLQDSQRPRLVSLFLDDLKRVTGIAHQRFQINSIVPGSLVVNMFILPSSNSADPLPLDGWRRLQAQIGVPSSDFSNGDVTQAYAGMAAHNYIVTTQCPDGVFRISCFESSSSTGMGGAWSSSGDYGNTTSTGDGQSNIGAPSSGSSGFLGGGTNQLVFIIVVAALGFVMVLLCCFALHYRRMRQVSRAKAEAALSAAGFGRAAHPASSDKSDTNVSSSGSDPERAFTRRNGGGGGGGAGGPASSASNSPRDLTSRSVQGTPRLSGGTPPSEPAVLQLSVPPGASFTSVVQSLAAATPGSVQMTEMVPPRPRLEKGNSPSTENTPENTPRGPRPLVPLASSSSSLLRGGARTLAPSARGAQLADVNVHMAVGNTSPAMNAAARRNSFRISSSGGARAGGAAGPRRIPKLNPAMIAAASGMTVAAPAASAAATAAAAGSIASPSSSPGASQQPGLSARPVGAMPPIRLGPAGLRQPGPGRGPLPARPVSPDNTVFEVDDGHGL